MAQAASMTTELLQLIWLASPALPVGGFSYSEALEAAIDHEYVHNESSCSDWLADQLHLSQARGDMALMAQAIPAWQTLNIARLKNSYTLKVLKVKFYRKCKLQISSCTRALLNHMVKLFLRLYILERQY